MIRLVELKNWRAYEDTAIDLSSKVVFFVAPNGVGKSSLMEAVRWCLLNQPLARHAKSAVRLGASSATVTVEIAFAESGQTLLVERSLTPAGKVTFSASLEGSAIREGQYMEILADQWNADPGLIDRLMFTDPQLPIAKSAFPVRDHLAAILGVKPLLNAVEHLQAARKSVTDQVAEHRRRVGDAEAAVASNQTMESTTTASLNTVIDQQQKLADEIKQAEAGARLARQWETFREEVAAHNEVAAEILAELGEVIELDDSAPQETLSAAHDEASAQLAEARQAKTELEINRAKSTSASDLLAGPSTTCPTCLRPLSEHERLTALAQHSDTIANADGGEEEAAETEITAQDRLNVLATFMSRLSALHAPPPPTEPDPGPEAEAFLIALRDQERALAEAGGRFRGILSAESNRAKSDRRLAQSRAALRAAAREEQLLSTTIEAFNNLADKTLRDRIDPLIEELAGRWKLLFGTDGLNLEPSGELTVNSADGILRISDLSGGERATAVLVARLLVTASTTQIPTVWFDEPLEHLDPRRRSAVARTLVRAGQTDTIEQLIVTTYEDRLARQLAAADPDNVRVVHSDIRTRD
ncbi:MAG: AAA family ATPase [Acidimicrobiia bacterium]|nr:AAA family ATPase [Acidimicrobiia bacterium]MYB11581.1 AAA family ATPase [Acidimicrobiia bacterium]MYG58095.1 AAA family ATPase [Acidimicrobiia bacterium]MYG73319.1 AAA family ATPase [Acidimicrobiia bacterium]MYH95222.1 AAA family ATPase [Acidimicrobiia bacterium]